MAQDDDPHGPEHWFWEALPQEFLHPEFETPCDHFRLERRADLTLWAVGVSYDPEAELPPREPAPVKGELNKGADLKFSRYGAHAIICESCFNLAQSRTSAVGKPSELTQEWRCGKAMWTLVEQEPASVIDWVLNMRFGGLILPDSTTSESESGFGRTRSGVDWKLPQSANRSGQNQSDHVNLELTINDETVVVNIGEAECGPQEWSPGFIEYAGTCPSDAARDRVRHAVSFALGCELVPVATSFFDDNGSLLRSSCGSVSLARVEAVWKSGPDPMTRLSGDTGLQRAYVDANKLGRIVQALLDSDSLLKLTGLSRFYFVARRSVLDIRPGMYGASLEYIRKRVDPGLATVLIHKAKYRSVIRPALEKAVRNIVDDEALTPGADIEDLLEKFQHFHKISLAAQTRALMSHLGLKFGEVELEAIKQRHHVAHGGTYGKETHESLMRHVRAFQTLNNRMILAASKAADTYFDYSANDFPERQLAEPLGGPSGDGEPATYSDAD